jgi:phosphoglycolate phosphatase-like HAD superfamily hydrolase
MGRVRGVILDMDGTLIDSNDAHAHAWLEAMEEKGFQPGFEKVRRLIGMGGDFLIPEALGIDPHSEEGKTISRRRKEIFREQYLPNLQPFAKVKELVLRMQAGGLKLVVASASKREELEAMMERAGISDLIDEATSASDVEEPKPEADVVYAALSKLGLPPEDVLMLGDTPYDIESAGKARVGVIALRCGGWDDEALQGARALYWDVADLFTHYGESPLAG